MKQIPRVKQVKICNWKYAPLDFYLGHPRLLDPPVIYFQAIFQPQIIATPFYSDLESALACRWEAKPPSPLLGNPSAIAA